MDYMLWNGRIVPKGEVRVDPEDRGYQFGDGVYEVIRVYHGNLFAEAEHFTRLERSLKELRIPFPYSLEKLSRQVNELVRLEKLEEGIIYLQVTRGTAPRAHAFPQEAEANVIAYASPYPRPVDTIVNGGSAILAEDIRWLRCDIKSINLLGNVLAKQAAKEAGALEAILHRGKTVTEGSSSNLFMVKEGKLFTHPLNSLILNGITRQVVVKLAHQLKIPLVEETFTIDQLFAADELFITSTTNEITPILTVDGKKIGHGVPGVISRQLQEAFERRIALLKA
ncbi:D-alanine aminotransferase [[Clostridium] ultunense Esp]|nr:D-alanine aminotransferase [[Clostridium] ultunense Esp]